MPWLGKDPDPVTNFSWLALFPRSLTCKLCVGIRPAFQNSYIRWVRMSTSQFSLPIFPGPFNSLFPPSQSQKQYYVTSIQNCSRDSRSQTNSLQFSATCCVSVRNFSGCLAIHPGWCSAPSSREYAVVQQINGKRTNIYSMQRTANISKGFKIQFWRKKSIYSTQGSIRLASMTDNQLLLAKADQSNLATIRHTVNIYMYIYIVKED